MELICTSADGTRKTSYVQEGPINFSFRGRVAPPKKIEITFLEGNAEEGYDVSAVIRLALKQIDVIVIGNPGSFTHPDFIDYHSVLLRPTNGTKGFLFLFRESTIGGNTKYYQWDRKPMTDPKMDILSVDLRLENDTCHRLVGFQASAEGSISDIDSALGYVLTPNEKKLDFVHLFSLSSSFDGQFERILEGLDMVQLTPGNSKLWSKKITEPEDLVSSVLVHKPFNVFTEVVKAEEIEDFDNAPPKFTMSFEPLSSRKIAALTEEERAKMVQQQEPLGADENQLFGLHVETFDNQRNRTDYVCEGPHPDGNDAFLLEIGSGVNSTPVFLCGDDCAELTCAQ